MSHQDNKIKFNLENLANVINQGSLQLVNFQKQQYTIKQIDMLERANNKLQMDQEGRLYTEKQDGSRKYRLKRQQFGLMPNFCPNCGKIMAKHPHDAFFWTVHKLCAKCSIIRQQQMRDEGTFNTFALTYMRDKLVDICNQAIAFYQQSKKQNERSVVINQQGQIEKWAIENPEQFRQVVEKVIKEIEEYRDEAIAYFEQRLKQQQEKLKDA